MGDGGGIEISSEIGLSTVGNKIAQTDGENADILYTRFGRIFNDEGHVQPRESPQQKEW